MIHVFGLLANLPESVRVNGIGRLTSYSALLTNGLLKDKNYKRWKIIFLREIDQVRVGW